MSSNISIDKSSLSLTSVETASNIDIALEPAQAEEEIHPTATACEVSATTSPSIDPPIEFSDQTNTDVIAETEPSISPNSELAEIEPSNSPASEVVATEASEIAATPPPVVEPVSIEEPPDASVSEPAEASTPDESSEVVATAIAESASTKEALPETPGADSEETAALEVALKEPPTEQTNAAAEVEPTSTAAIDDTDEPITEPKSDLSTQSVVALPPRKHISSLRLSSLALLVLLLISSVMPLSISVSYGVSAYATYQTLRSHASSGLQHLLNVKTLFAGAHSDSTSVLDPSKLTRASKELTAARQDFVQIQTLLDQAPAIHLVNQYLPQYRTQITTARAASQIGIDITAIGQSLISTALVLEPRFRSPLLAMNHTPLITSNDINLVGTTIDSIIPRLDDMQRQTRNLSLADLPASPQMRSQLQQYIPLLPRAKSFLMDIRTMLGPAQWLLGLNGPRTFLVQTMDRGELRPTGGFTGQYGELHIDAGRISPFSLRDIALLEYAGNSSVNGQLAPAAYRSWWPFANWGLRDSNLSADFPASARIAIAQYKSEVNHNVDGVILLTPFLIQHILRVIGPLQIARYHETITAENLEDRLHYYQLDNAGIRRSELIEHVEDPATARKLFTAEVSRTFMDHIRGASPNELLAIGMQLLQDLKTKDLQVYVTNEQIENLLRLYGDSAEIDRSTTHDGLYVVQTNVSASKASQYVRTILQDTVTLDALGGATHLLQMRLVYSQIGPVYGLDTYRDYVRVYIPPSAKFLWGDGFDSGQPLCGGPLPACSANGVYPHQELVCPTGQYQAGYAAPMLNDPYAGAEHPLDKIGPPTTLKSDEPQRAMFGGYIIVPKNCTMTVTLSWYVPPDNMPYNLLIQRQSGTYPELDLTMLPFPGDCSTLATSGLYFNGVLTRDTSFALKNALAIRNTRSDCTAKT